MARSETEVIGSSDFLSLRSAAEASSRKRAHRLYHQSDQDNPHRFLNGILRDSYVAPHRHRAVPKPESFVVLHGALGVVLFDDRGKVTACHRIAALTASDPLLPGQVCGIDLLPGLWHSIIALTEFTVIFEVKPGPYDPATDKEFAPWAPTEGDPAAGSYLEELRRLFT